MWHLSDLAAITSGKLTLSAAGPPRPVQFVHTDSRKAVLPGVTLFVALAGPRHNGHAYIDELYQRGVDQFIIDQPVDFLRFPNASFLSVESSLRALQLIAAWHRAKFTLPVVGITGSNGKTIVKEWLFQLLSPNYVVVKNPGSYNSQLGVPLSVLQIEPHHTIGIFEAGISQPAEMDKLRQVIQPTIGLFTNLGSAHDEGFESRQQKLDEKLTLFAECGAIVYCEDQPEVGETIRRRHPQALHIGWGSSAKAAVRVQLSSNQAQVVWAGRAFEFTLPFTDRASQENLLHAIVVALHLGADGQQISAVLPHINAVPMRLELKQAVNQCQLIDDTYNNDLAGLRTSLDFISSLPRDRKSLILSDIQQSGLPAAELSLQIYALLQRGKWHRLVGIGPVFSHLQSLPPVAAHQHFFSTAAEFLREFDHAQWHNEVILIKGARVFSFESIVQRLQRKMHGTVMRINLSAMVHNLNVFKSKLQPGVRVMAMVKAFAYGSGSEEVATLLQYHKADYLGVAYADEGVDLRRHRIRLPIMVMNPSVESIPQLLAYDLQPEVYSLKLLEALLADLNGKHLTIHLKIDTGMHRLGFTANELPHLLQLLRANPNLQVASVFSHLAAADDPAHDDFTKQQAELFLWQVGEIKSALGYASLLHLLNTPGILRFPQYQFDMVRLGIGLYGIDPTAFGTPLLPAASLVTTVSQVKQVKAGATVGYGRHGNVVRDTTIATIAIGYADGFSRAFSRGRGQVLINGQRAPVLGNVCMDMTMIDVTGMQVREGDEVTIFGEGLPIETVAALAGTIPYEILTNTSERVKRVFYTEEF